MLAAHISKYPSLLKSPHAEPLLNESDSKETSVLRLINDAPSWFLNKMLSPQLDKYKSKLSSLSKSPHAAPYPVLPVGLALKSSIPLLRATSTKNGFGLALYTTSSPTLDNV